MSSHPRQNELSKALASTQTMKLAAARSASALDTRAERRFDRITRIATRLLSVPVAAISVLGDNQEWFKSVRGWDIGCLPVEQSLGALAVGSSGPTLIEDTTEDERTKEHALVVGPPHFRFFAGMRLYESHGRVVGILSIMDTVPRQLSAEDVESLGDLCALAQNELLADQISDAQAVLTRKLSAARREALIDPLTRVWNRRGCQMALKTAFAEADAADSFVAIGIFDVDQFKAINDTLGHEVGDIVLRKIADVLISNLREFDIVCRLGGDEFLVILVDADARLASTALNRVRESLEREPVRTRHGDVSLTVSAGYTVREPRSTKSYEEMVLLADQALMAAKSAGKNRIQLAS